MPGFQEILVIAVVALLVFGPDRLPEVARTAGRVIARLRSETQRNLNEFRQAAEIEELERELRSLQRELRGTRDDLTKGVTTMLDADAAAPRATADPPPFDPEAT